MLTAQKRGFLPLNARDEVFRIGEEAIRNACHHSGGTNLNVEVRYTGNLALQVLDDGCGLDTALLRHGKPGHFGLSGMHGRAANIGGRLVFDVSRHKGTSLTLTVPGHLIFQILCGEQGVTHPAQKRIVNFKAFVTIPSSGARAEIRHKVCLPLGPTVNSSARLYYESREQPLQLSPANRVEVPVAVAVFPKEIPMPPRALAERGYNILRWTLMPSGGHFAAMEQPGLLAQDIREFFRPLR